MALIKCSECGKEISDKSKKCIYCGNPITIIAINRHCELCGGEIDLNNCECLRCGFTDIFLLNKKTRDESLKRFREKMEEIATGSSKSFRKKENKNEKN